MSNRSPQTLKKRQRELDKQRKQQEKFARRLDRNVKKREARMAKASDSGAPPLADGSTASPQNPTPEAT
jgi:hypothetical protein